MAKRTKARPKQPDRGPKDAAPRSGLAWPVWTAAILGVLYLYAHASMVPLSLSLWGGLLSALVLGR